MFGDPREADFVETKKEINGMFERDEFEVFLKSEAGENLNVVPSRFFLDTKHEHDRTKRCKVRFVMGAHRNSDKHALLKDIFTIRPDSSRLLFALGTICGDWTK